MKIKRIRYIFSNHYPFDLDSVDSLLFMFALILFNMIDLSIPSFLIILFITLSIKKVVFKFIDLKGILALFYYSLISRGIKRV